MRRLFLTAVVGAAYSIAFGASACSGQDAATSYIPDTPIAYDGRYLAGSFELPQGVYWDTCATRTPELLRHRVDGGSDGSAYLMFESGGCVTGCAADNPSLSLIDMWFVGAPSVSAMGVYFDAKNAVATDATGSVLFYGSGITCGQETLLAEIPLDHLQLTSDWSTRCATVEELGLYHGIGIAVTGGSHVIDLDAFRLGPPCHAPR